MSQKFRVKQIRIKSELANRSGIVTENMTSATPDKLVGTSFKNVLVNENGEQVVGPESAGGNSKLSVTQTTHGFGLLDWLRFDETTSTWVKAQADDVENLGHRHVVEVIDANNFVVAKDGVFDIPNALALGEYILSSATVGGFTQTIPTIEDSIILYGMEVIDANTVSIYTVSAYTAPAPLPTAPVMGMTGTTLVNQLFNDGADVTGTYISDGGATILSAGFVVYPQGNPTTIIGSPGVTEFTAGVQTSPINILLNGLDTDTSYCAKPYATNSIGTSYGEEICFTTNFNLYVTSFDPKNFLHNIDGGTGFNTDLYSIGVRPTDIVDTGSYLFIASYTSNQLHKIDKNTGLLVSSISTGNGPYLLQDSYDGIDTILVSNSNALNYQKYTISTNTLTTHAIGVQGFLLTQNNNKIYISCQLNNRIQIRNSLTNAFIADLNGLTTPRGMCNYGNFVYACIGSANTIVKIDTLTNAIVTSIPLSAGDNPIRLFVVGTKMYVSCFNSGILKVIDLNTDTYTGIGLVTGTTLSQICKSGLNKISIIGDANIITVDTSTDSIISNIVISPTLGGSGRGISLA